MEVQLQNSPALLHIAPVPAEQNQSISFLPYQDLMVEALSDFSNDVLSYTAMLDIAKEEIELLLIAKANNPGKINIERLIPRNVRLAVLNKLNRLMA
ncbi:MAG: hypothetical protein EOP54_12400 [Sphingobacteriales bacterium]|nr:MAG: hypothetical protein EOP54_12400 [Sphingobacteriales bacterium]